MEQWASYEGWGRTLRDTSARSNPPDAIVCAGRHIAGRMCVVVMCEGSGSMRDPAPCSVSGGLGSRGVGCPSRDGRRAAAFGMRRAWKRWVRKREREPRGEKRAWRSVFGGVGLLARRETSRDRHDTRLFFHLTAGGCGGGQLEGQIR